MSFQTVFFDLDGTVTDPAPGITHSVMHALAAYGITVTDEAALYPFIGPPLKESFLKYYGITDGDGAVARYREYFAPRGIFENRVYPGLEDLLRRLRDSGRQAVLATSKPEVFARRILDHFGLTPYFAFAAGSTMDETRLAKADVLRYAMAQVGADPAHSVMVGDREHDVIGAHTVGLPAIGVLWGYGSREELTAAGADALAETPAALQSLLDGAALSRR